MFHLVQLCVCPPIPFPFRFTRLVMSSFHQFSKHANDFFKVLKGLVSLSICHYLFFLIIGFQKFQFTENELIIISSLSLVIALHFQTPPFHFSYMLQEDMAANWTTTTQWCSFLSYGIATCTPNTL